MSDNDNDDMTGSEMTIEEEFKEKERKKANKGRS